MRRWKAIRTFRRHAESTPEVLRAFRDDRVRRIVAHAHARVPFYRRLLDEAGIDPSEIRGVDDLRRLPIVDKADLRSTPWEDRLASGVRADGLHTLRTSGSTGEPFLLTRTEKEVHILGTLVLRSMRDQGLQRRDVLAQVLNTRMDRPKASPLFRRVADMARFHRSIRVDALQDLRAVADRLGELQPDAMLGLAGYLTHLAGTLTDADRRSIRPRFIRAGAERVTPLMRERIGEGFGTRVFETYACWEFSLIGWECPETGLLHLCDDGVEIEIRTDGRPAVEGEEGEVIGTALHSYTMPFVRYRLADRATLGPDRCPCGAPYRTLKGVRGREVDYFHLPEGRLFDPFRFAYRIAYSARDWVERFRLVQDAVDRVAIEVVLRRTPTTEERAAAHAWAAEQLGPAVHFELREVEDIPYEASGKLRVAVSRIESHYED